MVDMVAEVFRRGLLSREVEDFMAARGEDLERRGLRDPREEEWSARVAAEVQAIRAMGDDDREGGAR
jgi:hypothetical protein